MNQKIDFSEFHYNPDGNECDEASYRKRCTVIRSLLNDGYSNMHIRFLKPLIIRDYSKDQITELFNRDSDTTDIKDFVSQMGIGA